MVSLDVRLTSNPTNEIIQTEILARRGKSSIGFIAVDPGRS